MSFIGGYQSDVNLNDINFVGDFPIDHSIGGFGITTGADDYMLALTPAILQYRQGLPLAVRFSETNTGEATLNVDERGVVPIRKILFGALAPLAANDLLQDKIYLLVYDGQYFQIANFREQIPIATESFTGVARIATQLETFLGIDNFNFITPLKLMTLINALAATQEEVDEGIINNKAVTPLTLANYIADKITGLWEDKGVLNCAGNPNFPAGEVGDAYTVSVGGKIGGALGQNVGVRDVIYCNTDNPGGLDEEVGYAWTIIQANLEPATELIAGYIRIATQIEVNAGVNNATAVSPLKLKTLLDARISTELLTGLIELATQAEVNAGLDDVRAVTSLKLMTLLNALLKYQAGAGASSIIPKQGAGNLAPGSFAAVLNGQNNRANSPYSSALGVFADALIYNEWAKAGGGFYNTKGSAQNSILNLLNIIPSGGGIYPVTPNGAGADASFRWLPPANCIQQFMAQFTVTHNSGAVGTPGETWTGIYEGVLKNTAGTLSWLGGAPTLREVRQDAGFSPSLGFLMGGGEITAFVIGMANRSLHASVTVYITQTKFGLS
ncbi:MAG: hypothetical protein AB7P01_18805 [Bacteroidia bacterium]